MAKKCPLYLPEGSVRAILVLKCTVIILILTVKGAEIPNPFFTVWAGMIAFYFGARYLEEKKQKNGDTILQDN